MSFITLAINKFFSLIGGAMTAVLLLLPNSPFTWNTSNIDNTYLRFFLWIIPLQDFITIATSFTVSVGLYYAIRVILRWMKVAGS